MTLKFQLRVKNRKQEWPAITRLKKESSRKKSFTEQVSTAAELETLILEVIGSILVYDDGYPEVYRGFLQSLHWNSRMAMIPSFHIPRQSVIISFSGLYQSSYWRLRKQANKPAQFFTILTILQYQPAGSTV
jgi:hypothetical protein